MRFILLIALLPPTVFADWKPLFNGKDMSGWKQAGWPGFTVEEGMLKTGGGMGLFYYEPAAFDDTTLRVLFKTTGERGNSGVVIRMPEQPKDAWYGVHNGYEVQIESTGDDWHCTGAIYSISKVSARNQKPAGEWNTLEIELKGAVTRVILNGKLVNEYTEGQPVPERKQWFEPIRGPRVNKGYIGLQNHDAQSIIYFKEVSVKK